MADTDNYEDGDYNDVIPDDDDELFDVDKPMGTKPKEDDQPLYRVFGGSKIPVSKAVGTLWKQRLDAACAAYDEVFQAWDATFKYYNNNQLKDLQTPRGTFKRGDSTENIIYANLNTTLPAIYSKDPDIAVNTIDEDDTDFMSALKSLLNVLFKGRDKLNAKPKMKRAAGLALLTNFGILKLDYTKKDDSREMAVQQLQALLDDLTKCTDSKQAEAVYGKIEALEATMEIYDPSGPKLGNVLPHNLIIDPYAEADDGTDGSWMIERTFILTTALNAKYTQPGEDGGKVLVYKPTHKAAFKSNEGKRDDGLGLVLTNLSTDVTENEPLERANYRGTYYTECFVVWDKTTRRVFLFSRDDWVWPIWVWDDPLEISRFFPYFIISFALSTGGTVSVGEAAYYLDQQDEVNDINRQLARIRRTVFDYFLYNSDNVTKDEAEKFVRAIRGEGMPNDPHILGVKAGEGRKASEFIEPFVPPSFDKSFEALFNKDSILKTVDRMSSTSDALRGAEFKTNTNTASVQSYQDAARMSVGAKIDQVEDTISDLATALAEMCVQNMDTDEVSRIIGKSQGAKWQQMDIQTFRANYSLECVAGTTEKQNSVFKKKEAVQITQVLGQFVNAAPKSITKVMLRVLEQAFTEVVIHPEDWKDIEEEADTQAQKGISTGGAAPNGASAPTGGQPPQSPPAGGASPAGDQLKQQLMALPPQIKQQVVAMKQKGLPDQQIKSFMLQALKKGGGSGAPSPAIQAPQTPPQTAAQ